MDPFLASVMPIVMQPGLLECGAADQMVVYKAAMYACQLILNRHIPVCLLQVIKLISQVIADFANGEISQQQKVFDTSMTLEEYMDKNFYKTASLIAASCKSAAVFSDCSQDVKDSMFEYGRHLGLAFQVIDDILDFTQTAEQLGKPQVTILCLHSSLSTYWHHFHEYVQHMLCKPLWALQ